MHIEKHISLKPFNTFAIDVEAESLAIAESAVEIQGLLSKQEYFNKKKLVLGGGSNVLFLNHFDGLIIQPAINEKTIVSCNDDSVIVKAGAGENWDNFVQWTINHSFGGLENLSLIPGNVGACPIQNIGAYGVEASDFIHKVEAIRISDGTLACFSQKECRFGYRESIFKQEFKNLYIITHVYFKLNSSPVYKTHYGSVAEEIKKIGQPVNLHSIRTAIISIRQSKLPDPEILPNAGSFFKNPVISVSKADDLKKAYPGIVCYDSIPGKVKIAAGWLIDFLGWKGKEHKGAAVHQHQALVLINKKNASGIEILELANEIKRSVLQTFGIDLEFEVNIVG
jgi:UDP-N-acetylmuramate dehydrogenase